LKKRQRVSQSIIGTEEFEAEKKQARVDYCKSMLEENGGKLDQI